ncbi:MAG: 4'-phosphopantetheinyl transferase superfamily protein [Clostridiales Family XIII bacterium]|jgi:phosphopantetheine--protein transferase-like protein|nr:4'-phosphopantetheinyl transferase superfamily protein [Clostridiales Family XIII bacterium]
MKLYLCEVNKEYGSGRNGLPDGMFRAAASDYLGADCGEDALRAAVGPHGKPYFSEPPLCGKTFFSISHSGAYRAALFHDAEVGLDVEDLGIRTGMTRERMEKLATRFFSQDEAEYLAKKRGAENDGDSAENDEDLAEFFRVWTAKEAYVKYTGDGISLGLSSFSVFEPPGGVAITTFSPRQGLICSCCSAGENKPEVVRWDYGQRGEAK